MSSRRPLIMGNWKMNLSLAQACALARGIKNEVAQLSAGPEVAVCPSHVHLPAVREILGGSSILVGAQDLVAQEPGACTGGTGAEQLRELQLHHVLIGHSERRQFFGETDASVREKIGAAFRVGLVPIVCIGETLDQREKGQTESVVLTQIQEGLTGLSAAQLSTLVLAYEPVWAIGTGRSASTVDVQEVHQLLRGALKEAGGNEVSASTRILYGGSVKPGNIASYMDCPDVDGALVGGASLDPVSFLQLVSFKNAGE